MLRYYEIMILPLYASLKLMRFMDDGLLFHPKFLTPSIDLILRTMYPPNLSVDILQKGVTSHISFLDVFIVTLRPLGHSVFLETHPLGPIHPLAFQHSEKCEGRVDGGGVHLISSSFLSQGILHAFLGKVEGGSHSLGIPPLYNH